MSKPERKITLVDRIGSFGCHRGHKIGDAFDYDTERGKLCPMAMHVAFPYIDILRHGGTPPKCSNGICECNMHWRKSLLAAKNGAVIAK